MLVPVFPGEEFDWPVEQANMLAESGDACQAAGDLPTAIEAWRQALQVLEDLGWPDLLGVGAKLEQAGAPSPPG